MQVFEGVLRVSLPHLIYLSPGNHSTFLLPTNSLLRGAWIAALRTGFSERGLKRSLGRPCSLCGQPSLSLFCHSVYWRSTDAPPRIEG
jgi:hypothetical protein